jgi:hypothetical protein
MNCKNISSIIFTFILFTHLYAAKVVLENEKLKAIFNKNTGTLEQLTSKITGWQIQRRPELALSFRMIVPTSERKYNPVFGEQKAPTNILLDKNKVIFTWHKGADYYKKWRKTWFKGPPKPQWYQKELIKYTTKDPYGNPHYHSGYSYQTATQLAGINPHRFSPD